MPILIDGWNFIRNASSHIDDIDNGLLESAEELISILEDFQLKHNDPITLVFDSRSGHLDLRDARTPKLKVVAARDADSYIKSRIDGIPERQRRNLRVVSSDREVYYYAKSAYAAPLRCEEFWDKVRRGSDPAVKKGRPF